MIRNSSFFWASDDLSQDDDNSNLESSISRTHSRCASDVVHSSPNATRPLENAQLAQHPLLSYGSANHASVASSESASRRKLFGLSNDAPTHENYAEKCKSIRFQVVIWHIGEINVQRGHLKMRFRITLFWDDTHSNEGTSPSKSHNSQSCVWVMEGRQNAYLKEFNPNNESTVRKVIDVPPVSILNAIELEIVTPPEITMLNSIKRSMRWTCMYNATLSQGEDMSVKDFPHDNHLIKLKIGVLAHRNTGGRWDRNIYTLDLAREEDSQGSTRTPHGLVVDHCHVPDFAFDKTNLLFEFIPLMYGGWNYSTKDRDVFLQVTLPVSRQSQHYDTSILPMLITLNIIAITCLTRNFASAVSPSEVFTWRSRKNVFYAIIFSPPLFSSLQIDCSYRDNAEHCIRSSWY